MQGCGAVWPSVSSVLCQGAQGLGTDRQRLRITADSSSNDLPWQRAHGAIVVHGLSAVPITHQRENQSTCHGNQGIIDIGGRTAASSLVDAHVTIKVSDLCVADTVRVVASTSPFGRHLRIQVIDGQCLLYDRGQGDPIKLTYCSN